jgi:formylglycine-generating enzyme required for sulfatase activity
MPWSSCRGRLAGDRDLKSHLNLPVLHVTAVQAHHFAHYLGGRLPTRNEWDRAAGLKGKPAGANEPRRQGPFRGVWEDGEKAKRPLIAVGRREEGPMPLGAMTEDVSPFGCRHMSANGLEWTNDLEEGETVAECMNKGHWPESPFVYLRGRHYGETRLLIFEEMR